MRAAIGLFAALAVVAGAASAESPGIVRTAGLYTPMPGVANDALLRRMGTIKVKCTCKGSTKSVTLEADPCPDGVQPTCECPKSAGGQPAAICAKARN
jgi:hypothetical protein